MTKITYTVDIIKRDNAYYIDTAIEGQPVSSLGPIDDANVAAGVRMAQAASVECALHQFSARLNEHLQQQRKAKAG